MSATMTAAGLPALTPEKLLALCGLWQAEGREVEITLNGGSMSPTILPGTRLRLHCRRDLPHVGDIIAYRQEGILVVHRLIEITGSPEAPMLTCLGDGNILSDAPVSADAFIGTVIAVSPMPLLQRVLFALRHPRRHVRYLVRLLRKR